VKATGNVATIDIHHKAIIVPKHLELEGMKILRSLQMAEGDGAALGCIMICDNPDRPVLTKFPLTIFHEDGRCDTRPMCRSCMIESLEVIAGSYFQGGNYKIEVLQSLADKLPMIPCVDCKANKQKEMWPQIPLGALLASLCMDSDEMAKLVEAWTVGVYHQTLHTSPEIVTFCPNHPDHPYLLGTSQWFACRKLDCYLVYCPQCKSWHQRDRPCITEGKKCPKCHVAIVKDGGCNHVTCRCGCHLCYACMAVFATPGECYSHLTHVHNGYD
jgi:hypothetical protein